MAREHMTKDAIIVAGGSAGLSHTHLTSRSVRLARMLMELGLNPGDRVCILLENSIDWLVCSWGIRRAGLLFVPVNWHLHPDEVRFIIDNSGSRVLITSDRLLALAREATAGLSFDGTYTVGGEAEGFLSLEQKLAGYSPLPPVEERDGGMMPYSSGTTGRPKGILRALPDAPFGQPSGLERLLQSLYGIDDDTVYLSPGPLYHAAAVGFTGATLNAGGTVVVMPSFDAETMLTEIQHQRVTHVQCVPTHFARLLRLPLALRQNYDLSSLRIVVHAAAPCPPQIKLAMIEWLGPIIYEYYAGSERCGLTAADSVEWIARPGTVGRSRTGAIHILDPDTRQELPQGEVGLVYFENPVPFEFHGEPGRAAESFSPQGWGTHGDLGRLDSDGYLYLCERRSDLILSGGVNVYPQEVENVIATHPGVADVGVIGLPDEDLGQRVAAVVQPLPGASLTVGELMDFTRSKLAHFKAPKVIVMAEALPRLPSGKLLRRELSKYFSWEDDR